MLSTSTVDKDEPPTMPEEGVEAREPIDLLFRDLHSGPEGLSHREAAHRLQVVGPNVLSVRRRLQWPGDLLRQLTHPLALLLWLAAGLAWLISAANLALAILAVVLLNAAVAMIQERQAERAVEALGQYLPQRASVIRDGTTVEIPTSELVPGDVLLVAEGQRIPADSRLLTGAVEVDASALTGESAPVQRSADATDAADRRLDSPVLLFSGTACVAGTATAVIHGTGRHTEIGRIAALSARVAPGSSPLERQVRRVAWLITAVAVGAAMAFLPLGLVAGLTVGEAFLFAIGLLVANVPEGLLPTITLALAAGARTMARRGALVKRLSAVETLGSTTTICTDKTGTLTANQMQVTQARSAAGSNLLDDPLLAQAAARCTTATLSDHDRGSTGDPTEIALLMHYRRLGGTLTDQQRTSERLRLFPFDPQRRRMATVDRVGGQIIVHVKGAPEDVLPRCVGLTDAARAAALGVLDDMAAQGLRVLAVATKSWPGQQPPDRDEAETGLRLLGLLGLLDPPRPEIEQAVADCHAAGITVHVVTGDNGRTAAAIARTVGIRVGRVIDGPTLTSMTDSDLDATLSGGNEIIFARADPEAKLRITEGLQHSGHVVAMTGDGVNDAPALRKADIGVAMGRDGTDVAREAATLVLTDDNFATIVTGVREGRRVYDNVRKFVLYIFAHAVPEVVPFLIFALAGGGVPLPLTVLQILAIDLGTETLPALALGREPAEPGLMERPPRRSEQSVISRRMLLRAWGVMGLISAVLVVGAFFAVLLESGWQFGDDVSTGSPLRQGYLQATTAAFAGIVACQLGTAVAARADRASLRSIGLFTNRLLLAGLAFEILFAASVIYLPPLQAVFGTAALPGWVLLMMLPFPVVVWGADETYRWFGRRRHLRRTAASETTLAGRVPSIR